MVNFSNDWDELLAPEFQKPYYLHLRETLKNEYKTQRVCPPMNDIYNALRLTAFSEVRVVILGQDPYHGPGQAHGLSFSVQRGVPIPPSLQNIYKELAQDVGFVHPSHGCLTDWAKSGVLLLNATLTVREGEANSHRDIGWGEFTDSVIERLATRAEPVVFMLWGAFAKAKAALIKDPRHLVLLASHPSPLSAYNGFFGCRHFSKANVFLAESGRQVDWQIQQ